MHDVARDTCARLDDLCRRAVAVRQASRLAQAHAAGVVADAHRYGATARTVHLAAIETRFAVGRHRRRRTGPVYAMADLVPATVAEQLNALLDAVTDYAIYVLDPVGGVVSWNGGAQRVKGYDAVDVLGRHFSMFFTADDVSDGLPQRLLDDAVSTGRAEDEGWRVRKDGTRFWASAVLTPVFDAERVLQGFVKVTRDETARKTADRERRLVDAYRDRERLARDMNDDVIARIFGAGLQIAGVRDLSHASPGAVERLDAALDELDQAIDRLRTILFESPPVVDE